ncbi:hypothetical protein RF11_11746 [Thelohanellus kitauei]|uniref:Serpin domain-containing protein n=1 Tax=Thelohanellus kitauei TaxID=669202 RepID=A0A0C2J0B3_THEKT|nr:hypothetical protein RF11_11746 [Thelohanellus kitauei]
MPKFEIPYSYDFVPALRKLGFNDIFYRNDSDFGPMTGHSVMMENLIQLTSFSVNEFGINVQRSHEASTSVESDVEIILVNRPFLLLIYSPEHNLVHFSALVKKPTTLVDGRLGALVLVCDDLDMNSDTVRDVTMPWLNPEVSYMSFNTGTIHT